ncbi:hypothetical protein [Bacteroides sp. D2]|jgi:hypothetical protein|uniref:hypothetical protein n=1 Tax=Bacteroides TaxID=816 RepID=UPI0001BC7B90|nr:hypothetical protein [Bacteroides sp. D2]EFS33531.1 hypothetical protein BSGG_4231 [Bacteroides sp. D2]UWN98804.1 hypothetical protein NQ505_20610 [Bacteroides sp. D2]
MGKIDNIEALLEFRQKRLASFDVNEPYVWRLHLTHEEFAQLDSCIYEVVTHHSGSLRGMMTEDLSLVMIVYLAEWYKRVYCGNKQETSFVAKIGSGELKQLWELSGISRDKYVYKTDNGISLWKYSIYVLGGLAIQHELARGDHNRFLKMLCRIYYGEECNLEELNDAGRAIAFQQSIRQGHSLHVFLNDILRGNYEDSDADMTRLLTAIRCANDEVLRSKFRIEWLVHYDPAATTMQRKLRVWLKPEETGGVLYQYLRYERLQSWGLVHPEQIKWLHFGLRWYDKTKVVQDIDRKKPLISYCNTNNGYGFLSWGIDKYAVSNSIPTEEFTHLEIIAFDDNHQECFIQREEVFEWLQLWRIDAWKDDWSSMKSAQHQTAVIYSARCLANQEADDCKAFHGKGTAMSDVWSWNYIQSSIILTDSRGQEHVLYNHMGYDQIFAHLYKDTICYQDGGLVRVMVHDEEEGDIEELFPLIFGKHDVRICHFDTKESDEEPMTDEVADEVEFKGENGRYVLWTEDDEPPMGLITIRVQIKGKYCTERMAHLQGPIVRDLQHQTICYLNEEGQLSTYQDTISLDKQPLAPTVELEIGDVTLNVYRPTDVKEVYIDGQVLTYANKEDGLTIPYILKHRLAIADFGMHGYYHYDCSYLSSIYPLMGDNNNSALGCWRDGKLWSAQELDEKAPDWLSVCVGTKQETDAQSFDKQDLQFYLCNLYKNEPPKAVNYNEVHCIGKGEILFQDLRAPTESLTNIFPKIGKPDPWAKKKKIENIELNCFLIAAQYNLYFEIFSPLRDIGYADKKRQLHEWNEKVLRPLLCFRNGELTQNDKDCIARFAEEFRWDAIPCEYIQVDNNI